jgi:hypothetical protein
MIDTNIQTIYKGISALTNNEKMVIISKLMIEISPYLVERGKNVNIYDIKGVGKEVWEEIDAQKYVDKERVSWK